MIGPPVSDLGKFQDADPLIPELLISGPSLTQTRVYKLASPDAWVCGSWALSAPSARDSSLTSRRLARAEWAAYGGMRNAQIQDDGLRADVDLSLGASGCTSVPPAPPLAVERPKSVPAWIMEPAPNLIPLLDRIVSPSGKESGG